jgi:hypothetical protein
MAVEAAVVQYRQSMVDQFEQKSSVLRSVCTKEAVRNGNQATFLVAGANGDTAVTRGTNGLIPYGNPQNAQTTITLVEKHAPYELTGFNVFASQGDQLAVMRQASMSVINRDIDLTVLAALASATIDTGTSATASVDMVLDSLAELGNNDVPTEEADNMFAIITPSFMSYLMRLTEFSNTDYVDFKTYSGAIRKLLRWAGVNWIQSSRVTGLGTSTELCYMFHRSAIGYSVNLGEDSVQIGYDAKQDLSWSRATIFHGAALLQNSGIVQMKHDGSGNNLS